MEAARCSRLPEGVELAAPGMGGRGSCWDRPLRSRGEGGTFCLPPAWSDEFNKLQT